MSDPDVTTQTSAFTEGMALLADNLAVIAATATGFKTQLEQNGWSPTVAEQAASGVLFALEQNILQVWTGTR